MSDADDWIDELLDEVQPFHHVLKREIPRDKLVELERRATKRRIGVFAQTFTDGKVLVTMKLLIGRG